MPQKILLPLVLIALWCPSLPAAQDIETIIITASRIPQPLHTVGSSVTVIDLDDWRGTGATISDILREIPGLTVSQQGGSGTLTALRMRGGESNHTRILLDGIELSDPTSGVVDFAHLSIRDRANRDPAGRAERRVGERRHLRHRQPDQPKRRQFQPDPEIRLEPAS